MALSTSALIELCRVLRHYLKAGLSIVDVFEKQAEGGPASVRPIARRMADKLERGTSFGDALESEASHFPPIFLSLARVGDQTGMLPEVFGELERYFLRQRELTRRFLAQIAWPVFQFVMSVLVITGLIWFLGSLGPGIDGKPYDPLGLGLRGEWGAAIFFFSVVGVIVGLYLLYAFMRRTIAGTVAVDRLLLRLPAIGPCMLALALGRFCLALRLTTESGMSIGKALRLSLRATGNAAFAAAATEATATVRRGDEIALALSATGLFPDDFIHILTVAEESGTLTEVMKHQGEHYHEEASRRMALLTSLAGGLVWILTAGFIIVAIFRLYFSYLSGISSVLP